MFPDLQTILWAEGKIFTLEEENEILRRTLNAEQQTKAKAYKDYEKQIRDLKSKLGNKEK